MVPTGSMLPENAVGPLLFACHGPLHQLSYEYERELQAVVAARLVEELAESVGARHVVGGDFNADPSVSSVAFWRGERSLKGASMLPRRLGEGAPWGSGTHVHAAQPVGVGE
jgi:hypothetical protein